MSDNFNKQNYIYLAFVSAILVLIGFIFKLQLEKQYIIHDQAIAGTATGLQNLNTKFDTLVAELNKALGSSQPNQAGQTPPVQPAPAKEPKPDTNK